jgi:DNA-binding MarR family transcriptional regulator
MTLPSGEDDDKRAPGGRSERFKGLARQLNPGSNTSALHATELGSSLGFLLRVASGVAQDKFVRRLEASGLRQTLFTLLVVIEGNPGLKQQEIGQILSIQQPNLVSLVNELVQLGLVERLANAVDRRSYSLTLTQKGQQALADARSLHACNEKMLSDAVDPMTLDDFRAALHRIIGTSMND